MKNEKNSLDKKIFQDNSKKFNQKIGKDTLWIEQLKSCWSNICSHQKLYYKKGRWIENTKIAYKNNESQTCEDITTRGIINTLKRAHK